MSRLRLQALGFKDASSYKGRRVSHVKQFTEHYDFVNLPEGQMGTRRVSQGDSQLSQLIVLLFARMKRRTRVRITTENE